MTGIRNTTPVLYPSSGIIEIEYRYSTGICVTGIRDKTPCFIYILMRGHVYVLHILCVFVVHVLCLHNTCICFTTPCFVYTLMHATKHTHTDVFLGVLGMIDR